MGSDKRDEMRGITAILAKESILIAASGASCSLHLVAVGACKNCNLLHQMLLSHIMRELHPGLITTTKYLCALRETLCVHHVLHAGRHHPQCTGDPDP
jgi:hypothetical protein